MRLPRVLFRVVISAVFTYVYIKMRMMNATGLAWLQAPPLSWSSTGSGLTISFQTRIIFKSWNILYHLLIYSLFQDWVLKYFHNVATPAILSIKDQLGNRKPNTMVKFEWHRKVLFGEILGAPIMFCIIFLFILYFKIENISVLTERMGARKGSTHESQLRRISWNSFSFV